MYKDKKILAVVIARENSKGLKDKNLKILINKPLVMWPIHAALGSKYIDKVLLSTDSMKIVNKVKKRVKNYKFFIPFIRPKNLATSKSNSRDVVIHAIKFLQNRKIFFFFLLMLEPTSPSTTNRDIDNAIKKLISSKNSNSLVSVGQVESQHEIFQFELSKNMHLKRKKTKKYRYLNRQKLPKKYYLDGSLYISRIKTFLKDKDFIGEKTLSYIMPKFKNFEIDDKFDLLLARELIKFRK